MADTYNARVQFSTAPVTDWETVNPQLKEGELVLAKTAAGKYRLVVGGAGGSRYKDSVVVWDEADAQDLAALMKRYLREARDARDSASDSESDSSRYADDAQESEDKAREYMELAAEYAKRLTYATVDEVMEGKKEIGAVSPYTLQQKINSSITTGKVTHDVHTNDMDLLSQAIVNMDNVLQTYDEREVSVFYSRDGGSSWLTYPELDGRKLVNQFAKDAAASPGNTSAATPQGQLKVTCRYRKTVTVQTLYICATVHLGCYVDVAADGTQGEEIIRDVKLNGGYRAWTRITLAEPVRLTQGQALSLVFHYGAGVNPQLSSLVVHTIIGKSGYINGEFSAREDIQNYVPGMDEEGRLQAPGGIISGGTIAGNLTGNVTGDVTGNLAGNVTGQVTNTGDLTIKDGILRMNKNGQNSPVIQTGTAYNDGEPTINIGFGAGGNTVVGAGGATRYELGRLTDSRRKDMYVLAEQDVIIKSNCEEGSYYAKTLTFTKGGDLILNGGKVLNEKSFTQGFMSNGWCKMPNGLILQWGKYSNHNDSGRVVFPLAFPHSCFSIAATHATGGWDPGEVSVWDLTNDGFQVGGQAANHYSWYWMAVGY